jgi:hypothetical protein
MKKWPSFCQRDNKNEGIGSWYSPEDSTVRFVFHIGLPVCWRTALVQKLPTDCFSKLMSFHHRMSNLHQISSQDKWVTEMKPESFLICWPIGQLVPKDKPIHKNIRTWNTQKLLWCFHCWLIGGTDTICYPEQRILWKKKFWVELHINVMGKCGWQKNPWSNGWEIWDRTLDVILKKRGILV